jgi:uncharacterized Ntn-hydrolase superfamily protein
MKIICYRSFNTLIIVLVLCFINGITGKAFCQSCPENEPFAHTFSIVARDTVTGDMAVGVQSHWFSVGTVVSWGQSGVGVVATQSFVNISFGPNGLKLLNEGKNAGEVVKELIEEDEGRDYRQLAVIDNMGHVSTYTGKKCIECASHYTGKDFSVQANMMLNDKVVPAMVKAYEQHNRLPLAERVVAVLQAAQEAGGDIRGKQSAALIVVGPEKVSESWLDKKVDLRIEDYLEPIIELERLLKVHRAYEHMNRGDVALEKEDMATALKEYGAAEEMFPENQEFIFWTAVTLANHRRINEALPRFKQVFNANDNWRELTGRLPESGLLKVPDEDMKKIMEL